MGLMQRALAVVRKAWPGISFGGVSANNFKASIMWAHGLPEAPSTLVAEPYRQSSTIGLAIDGFTSDAASVEWEVYPKGGDEPIDPQDHPVLALWERPNPRMYGRSLFKYTYLSWWLHGESIWYLEDVRLGISNGLRASSRSNGELVVLNPALCIATYDKAGKEQWSIRVDGRDMPLDMERLVLFRNPNPYNPLRGLSPIDSIILEVEGDYAAARWNRDTFGERNGIPSGMLIPPADANLPPEDREYYTRLWNQNYGAGRKSVGIIPPGWQFKDASLTQRDADFLKLREFSREQILARIGYPPFLAGVLDKANYANAREQRDVYWNTKIASFLVQFQDCLNYDFLPRIGAGDIEVYPAWEFVRAQTENFAEKVEIASKLQAMGFTRRQINARLELGFDVDENEDADIAYLPFSLTPLSTVLDPPEQTVPSTADGASSETSRAVKGSFAGTSESRRAMVWRAIAYRTRDLEDRFNRVVRKHFAAIEREALAALDSIRGWQAIREKSFKAFDPFDSASLKRDLQRSVQPIYQATVRRGGDSLFAQIKAVSKEFNYTDPRVLGKVAELTGKITRITETVEADLREALVEGIQEGESASELAGRVRGVMSASRSRSLTIARTETGQGFSFGRDLGMRQAGINRHEWLSARDDKVRDDHALEDGSVVHIGEEFPNTGLRYPLDSGGPPEQIINCRCVAIPVVEDVDSEEVA